MNMMPATVATNHNAHTTTHVYVRAIIGDIAHVHQLLKNNDYTGLFNTLPVSHLSNFRIEMIAA